MNAEDAHRAESWLVLRAQSGDRSAWDSLFRMTQTWLHRYLQRLTADGHAADEQLQSVFLVIYRNLRHLRDPRAYRSWVYRIASREVYRLIKRRRFKRDDSGSLLETQAPPDLPPMDGDSLRELEREIHKLPPNSRTAIVLHYYEEMTIGRVAAVLDLPEGTVKSRIAYGLARLRRRLNQEVKK